MSVDDSSLRRDALDPARSFAVSAPAGSGKTELLIRRYLVLLARVERPENILAITFTRKAAAEMQARILTALNEAAANVTARSSHHAQTLELARAALLHSRRSGWQLELSAGRMQIRTIDSFCQQVASALPMQSGIGPATALVDQPGPHYRQATRNLIEHADIDQRTGAAIRALLRFYDNDLDKLAGLLSDLLGNRLLWLPELGGGSPNRQQLESRLQLLIEEELARTGALAALWPELRELVEYAADHLDGPTADDLRSAAGSASLPECRASSLGAWRAICQLLLTGSNAARKQVTKRDGFPTAKESRHPERAKSCKARMEALLAELGQRPDLVQRLVAVRLLPDPRYSATEWPVIEALGILLPRLAASLDLEFRANRCSDFAGVALAALGALRDTDGPTRLALRLDYRIEHILVDEFQDTSSQQVELLDRLTESWQPGDLRSLFIVGDGMQSIYGFRKANVGLFIRARRSGLGSVELESLDLTANFRSRGNLVDWYNAHFPELFPAEDDIGHGQVCYRSSRPTREASDESAVELLASATQDEEAGQIAGRVADLLQRFPAQKIGILVRARSHLAKLLPALRRSGLRWQGTDIEPLGDRLWVSDLHALTRLIHAPADRMAWLTALRAPYAGLDPADLLALCQRADREPEFPPRIDSNFRERDRIPGLSDTARVILDRLDGALTRARRDLGRLPLRSLVEHTWRRVGGPQTMRSPAWWADVEAYFELIERHDRGGAIEAWETFDEEFARLYSRPDPEGDPRLQVMTIHKAKGLEFDTVVLPRLEAIPGGDTSPLLLWWEREFADGETHFLLSNKGMRHEPAPIYDYLKSEEAARRREENVRLLYVACTRARERLLLSAVPGRDDATGELREPAKNSLLETLWPQLGDRFRELAVIAPVAETPVEPPEPQFGRAIYRLPPTWHPDTSRARAADRESVKQPASDPIQTPRARRLGTLLHASLQRYVTDSPLDSADAWIAAQHRVWSLGDGETDSGIAELERQVRLVLSDAAGRWILHPSHQSAEAEFSLDYLDRDGTLRSAVIDRTFVGNGYRWIVDYKSSRPAPGESEQDFFARQANLYAGQLRRYRQLMESDEQPVRTLLYFTALPACIEIDSEDRFSLFRVPDAEAGAAH